MTGGYDFSPVRVQERAGPDYGHIVAVSPVRDPSGRIAVVEADNEHVDAGLRGTDSGRNDAGARAQWPER